MILPTSLARSVGIARVAVIVLVLLSSATAAGDDPPAEAGVEADQEEAQTPAPRPGDPRAGVERSGFDSAGPRLVSRSEQSISVLAGRPVRAVSVETTGTMWKSSPKLESVAIGTPLSTEVGRRAIRELLSGGGFAQAWADARPYQDGVILRVVALPRRLVAAIRVSGGSLPAERTLAAAELAEGDEITEPQMARIDAAIRRHYAEHGYDQAVVQLETQDTDDPMEVLLDVTIEPGIQRTVSRRIFVIEPALDRLVGERKHEYAVETGDEIDEDDLREADNEMADTLRADGFLDVEVKHRVLRRGEDTFLYVYLQTGPLYRFSFEGNQRRDEEDLEDALALDEPGTEVTPEALTERLRQWYQARGYLDARVQVAIDESDDGAVVNLRFRLHEGELVRVSQRLFPCLPPAGAQEEIGAEGVSAEELGLEIDGVLIENLPSMPLFHEVEELAVDAIFSPDTGGSRARGRRLEPAVTYTPEAYETARRHLEQLLNSKGYLSAVVGPVSVLRARCDPKARGGRCRPLPLPPHDQAACRSDALELPVPEEPLDEAVTCVSDPTRGIHCAPTLALHIPVQLGPQMRLYDAVFEGNRVLSSRDLLDIAEFPLGAPFSNLELDAAQARILGAYRDKGYAYATLRVDVDHSPDRTRARVRYVITEHQPVVIEEYEVRGADKTDTDLIISRLSLCQQLDECQGEERYYKRNLARESEEQIATLGTFSSVSIALEDPDIPQGRKRVIITVTELPSQYIEPSGGFFTGDGFRAGIEYGHRNIGGQAIALTVRLELAILPDFLILDQDVRDNYSGFTVSERLERRNTLSVRFPNIGLGPKFDLVVNGVDARDNQRDFGITREAFFPTLNYRPVRQVGLALGASTELNDVTLFNADSVDSAIQRNRALANILRVPDGRTIAFAQRLSFLWDRRNKPLAATSGTLLGSAVEHVTALPLDQSSQFNSEFVKLTSRLAGYIPLGDGGWAVAMSFSTGYNLQLTADSLTYPDRLFYLGGVNTVRGFQLDEMVPQDVADRIRAGSLAIDEVGVRGGDLFVNPRLELRIPLTDLFSAGLFLDTGNVWTSIDAIQSLVDMLELRYTSGAGLRLETPLGPVALDYGFKLARYEWEDLGALHFSIGLF